MNHGITTILGGAGFCPSTVCWWCFFAIEFCSATPHGNWKEDMFNERVVNSRNHEVILDRHTANTALDTNHMMLSVFAFDILFLVMHQYRSFDHVLDFFLGGSSFCSGKSSGSSRCGDGSVCLFSATKLLPCRWLKFNKGWRFRWDPSYYITSRTILFGIVLGQWQFPPIFHTKSKQMISMKFTTPTGFFTRKELHWWLVCRTSFWGWWKNPPWN